jgi:hypothetical protein
LNIPFWLLRLLPMWGYICPSCRKEVEKNSHECPHCGGKYGKPLRVPHRVLKDKKKLEDYVHKKVFPRVSKAQRAYLAQFFTELFIDEFESGDFSAWTSVDAGSPSVVGSPVHHGSYAAEFDTDADEYLRQSLGGSQSTVYARAYVRFANLPTSGQKMKFMGFQSSSGFWPEVLLRNDGGTVKWGIIGYDGTEYLVSSPLPSVDVWYCVEFKVSNSGDDNDVRLYVDGLSLLNTSDSSRTFNNSYFGHWENNDAITNYVDCVVIADTYIGPETATQTYTQTWQTDILFKKLGIQKFLGLDTAFQKQDIQTTFTLDATFQKSVTSQKQIDALFQKLDELGTFGIDVEFLKKDVIESFALDARFSALAIHTISRQIDVLLKKLDVTKNFGVDVYFGAAAAETQGRTFGLDVIFAYKVRLPELWLDENGKVVLNVSKPYVLVGS